MIKSVLAFSIAYRWIVVTVSVGVALLGVYALLHLRSMRFPTSPTTKFRSTPQRLHCLRLKSKSR